jgi:hypothetical protein
LSNSGVSGRFVKLPAATKRRCRFWGRIFPVRWREGCVFTLAARAVKVARLLLRTGVAVEAGIWNVPAAERLRRCGLSEHCLRLLLEPAQESGDPHARFHDIEAALAGVQSQRLLHGFEAATWVFIELAAKRGYDTRVGLEDTLVLPDGTCARDNAELVAAARRIVAQQKP